MVVAEAWGASNDHKAIVSIKDRQVKHFYVSDAAKAAEAAKLLSDAGHDVYFAPATFDTKARKQDNAAGVRAMWVDVDCGEGKPYADWKRGLLTLLSWCKRSTVPMPSHIVLSGYGVHAYWLLDAAYPHSAWLPVAQHFKQALKLGGVEVDPTRTADAASIMRVPGTRNWKNPDDPKPVEELHASQRRVALDEFRSSLPKVGPIRPVRTEPRSDEWGIPDNYPLGDAPAIADKCQQMASIRDNQGKVAEPLWRAGLSVLQRCDEAEHYLHEWSKGDERYDPEETRQKAERTGGPATCQHFSDCNPGGCLGCPHAGKISSPVQLAVAGAVPAAKPELHAGEPTPDDWRPSSVNAFQITDAGIYWTPPQEEGVEPTPVRVTQVPLWIVEVRERARLSTEQDASSLLIEWRSVDGRTKQGVLHQAHVHDMRAFKTWLADHNIIAAVEEVKLLVAYIGQYTLKLLKKQGAREYHEALGWYNDGFVVGDQIITKDGAKSSLIQTNNPISRMKAKGSLDAWKAGVSVLAAPKYAKHAFALLCGFGSAVLPLADAQSAVVSLVGKSGAGKTVSARAALSIYGNPDLLMQGASATPNAVEKQLSANRHVPYLLDEVTQYGVGKLTEFIYLAANGQGKAALTRTRDTREAGTWQLVPFITSNISALEFSQAEVQEAHRRRLIEIYFTEAMDGEDGKSVDSAIRNNYGVAAEPFLKALAAVRKDVPAMFDRVRERLQRESSIDSASRFGLWTMAAAYVGGTIAKAAGLIDFDPMTVIMAAMAEYKDEVQQVRTDEERAEDVAKEWLAENSRRICHWGRGQDGKDVLGDITDDPVARDFKNGVVAVHRSRFNATLADEKISRRAVKVWLAEAVVAEKVVRLAPGTPGVWCYLFNADALGMDQSK
jgi:hypothetical protein